MLVWGVPGIPPPTRAVTGSAPLSFVRMILAMVESGPAADVPSPGPLKTNVPLLLRMRFDVARMDEAVAGLVAVLLARKVVAPAAVMVPKFCVTNPPAAPLLIVWIKPLVTEIGVLALMRALLMELPPE